MTSGIDVTVAAVIESDQRFLVVEEFVGGQPVYNQPAGHLEVGESLEAAVVREVLEETAFAFTPEALLGVAVYRCEARSFVRITFAGSAVAPGATPQLDDGIVATHWLSRAELMQRAAKLRSPLVLNDIDRYLSGTRYPLTAVADLLPDTGAFANIA